MLHLSKAYWLPFGGMRLCNIQLQVPEFLWYEGSYLSPQCIFSGISGEQEGVRPEPDSSCLGRMVLLRWWVMETMVHLGVTWCSGCGTGANGASLGGQGVQVQSSRFRQDIVAEIIFLSVFLSYF